MTGAEVDKGCAVVGIPALEDFPEVFNVSIKDKLVGVTRNTHLSYEIVRVFVRTYLLD